jgi:hypothetical protein
MGSAPGITAGAPTPWPKLAPQPPQPVPHPLPHPSQQLSQQLQQQFLLKRALRRSIRLGLQQLSQQELQQLEQVLQQLEQVLQELEQQLSQQLLQLRRARSRSIRLGLQQQLSQQLSQQPPQLLPHPPPLQPATGALATAVACAGAAVGAGSAPANHAVVTNKNAAFTRVILRWSLTSAEGRRDSAGSGPVREKWRPAPSSIYPQQRNRRLHGNCAPLISESFFRPARSPRLSSFPKNLPVHAFASLPRSPTCFLEARHIACGLYDPP